MQQVNIRAYQASDLKAIMDLWLDTNVAAHDFIDEDYWRSNYDTVRQMIPEATLYVFEDQGIKGFAGLNGTYIAGIFVDKTQQSKGVGKQLLDFIKEKNVELMLQVYKKNNRAVQFYLREGFEIEKEQLDIHTSETELVMKWTKQP